VPLKKEVKIEAIKKRFSQDEYLSVEGARVHNLQNISISIPRNKLVVFTGLSGSGKSSLAFDTIYAEGQRRYMETFSSYARQFIGNMERPDVDNITGLSPVISIEQKTTNKNPRSTVGTITEIYDFLRLLFARASDAISYKSGQPMVRYTTENILEMLKDDYADKQIAILAPLVKGRKGNYRELFERMNRLGYIRVRLDGEIVEIFPRMQADRYKTHDIELVVDRLEVNEKSEGRLKKSLDTAMELGKGSVVILDYKTEEIRHFSRLLMCPESGVSYEEPEPNNFSFNSPYGACPSCNGLGTVAKVDLEKIFPDKKLSIRKGGIAPLGEYKNNWIFSQIEAIAIRYDFSIDTPVDEIPEKAIDVILNGQTDGYKVQKKFNGVINTYTLNFDGIINFILEQHKESESRSIQKWVNGFLITATCPECDGFRLKKESLWFRINGKHIGEYANLELVDLLKAVKEMEQNFTGPKAKIGVEILREINTRLQFLLNVGLEYLSLNRSVRTLSGGESQRIRLATQIGSQLMGVLYILDEPSIGLHQRDNHRLIKSLENLRDVGNTILVVEHDKDMILAANHVVDIGPGAGRLGGKIIAQGTPEDILNANSLTAEYLSGRKSIDIDKKIRKGNGKTIVLEGAKGHNLKNVTAKFPLGKLICVTGVSGSGKSSLVNQTLYPILSHFFYRSEKKPLPYSKISGLEHIDKVIEINQSPIGRTPRSNPATYTKVFDEIRKLYVMLPEAKIRGYKAGRFSFNVKGGRCETCLGAGIKTIEMNFLPDVYVECDSCQGKRYNRETLEVRYKGKSINDVLNMTINQAVDFFENMPNIIRKIKTLQDVGLGYITLGQQSTTLSGGEAQRVKLASELSKRDTGKTLYILDEPTTGLHFEDVRVLMGVLNTLADKGNTVIVIEHNMEVIKLADYIIDVGPEGGKRGGEIVATGTPKEITKEPASLTGKYLLEEL